MKYNLTADELKNPNLVFENLVTSIDHENAKNILWLWFKATVTESFSSELENSKKIQLLMLYEHLVKIIDGIFYKYEDFSVGKLREQVLMNQD